GSTALSALALLECGVPTTDPHIARAANYIRKHWPDNTHTYELSLSLLFLDKLGDKKDKPIVQALALRLVSGQTPNGGWTYNCPILTNQQATQLMTALKKDRAKTLPNFIEKSEKAALPNTVDKGEKNPVTNSVPKTDKSKTGDPAYKPGGAPPPKQQDN